MRIFSPIKYLLMSFILLCSNSCLAEQKIVVGDYEVHYIVIPTTFLDSTIANQYNLVRGDDRALVNISILETHRNGETQQDIKGVVAEVTGTSKNLMGQRQILSFSEVREQDAIYYLAQLRHADEEYHRIEIDIVLANGETAHLDFKQKMYWERE